MELWVKCSQVMQTRKFVIAGGAVCSVVLGENPKDIDCFFESPEEFARANMSLRSNPDFKITKERKNSTQFKNEKESLVIDIINPEPDREGIYKRYTEIVDWFDLVHTCVYFSGSEGIVEVHPDAIMHALKKTIKIHKVCLPYHTLGRIAKYRNRGFSVDCTEERLILDYCYKAPWGASAESEYNFETSNTPEEQAA